MLARKQRGNAWAMLLGVAQYCKSRGFTRAQLHQHMREALMCARVESNLWIYANVNVEDSFGYPHDLVGSDHLSVGMFQQQVPSWGKTGVCMSPGGSAHKFLNRMSELGLDAPISPSPMALGQRVQQVQVSAFPDRYAAQFGWAGRYLRSFNRYGRLLRAADYPKDKR